MMLYALPALDATKPEPEPCATSRCPPGRQSRRWGLELGRWQQRLARTMPTRAQLNQSQHTTHLLMVKSRHQRAHHTTIKALQAEYGRCFAAPNGRTDLSGLRG